MSGLWSGKVVAAHERCWSRRQTVTDPEHAEAAAALRAAHRQIRKQPVVTDVAVRELTDYDRVFGLHEDPDEDLASGSRVDLAVDGEGD